MKSIANLLFEARMLKSTPRSGFAFLGAGRETVAEHSFMITMVAFVFTRMNPRLDAARLLAMCLLHDLPESRTGDLNYVQKKYVSADEPKAVDDLIAELPFGTSVSELIGEYNAADTVEAKLAHDADQIALLLDLKALSDMGHSPTAKWIPAVSNRIRTGMGRELAEAIMDTEWDEWWLKNYVDTPE